jgi:hypothetical protein
MKQVLIAGAAVLAALTVGVTSASAQTRPAMVRSVDEPARVPFFESMTPVCTFSNQCISRFPTVPAGKRLRVLAVNGFFRNTNVPGFVAFQKGNVTHTLFAFPVSPFSGAYYGPLISFNESVDMYFEAGEVPVLEFGIPSGLGGIFIDGDNRLTVSGYLVDVAP